MSRLTEAEKRELRRPVGKQTPTRRAQPAASVLAYAAFATFASRLTTAEKPVRLHLGTSWKL